LASNNDSEDKFLGRLKDEEEDDYDLSDSDTKKKRKKAVKKNLSGKK
jgi:hypothetical protein